MKLDKSSLRTYYKSRLLELSDQDKQLSSQLLTNKLYNYLEKNATIKHIGIFAGTTTEPYLLHIIQLAAEQRLEVKFYLPKITDTQQSLMHFEQVTNEQELTRGAYDILEPTSGILAPLLDLILVPGLAFTNQGARLGQGGGYYDRFLNKYPDTDTLGVGFHCQLADLLSIEHHDIALNNIWLK